MKFFLLEGEHLVPFEELVHLVDAHHAFLQRGYDRGDFLFSGPQVPPHGGFLVAKAKDREALDRLLGDEPFVARVRCGSVELSNSNQHRTLPC